MRSPLQNPARYIIILILCVSCRNSLPPCTPSEVADYFLYPSPSAYARIIAGKPDTGAFDSVMLDMRKNSLPGRFNVTLADTCGVAYRIGGTTPGAFRTDTVYPLIVYLHGGSATLRNDKGDSAWLMLAPLVDSCSSFIVSPSASRNALWWSPAGLSRILQTVRYMTMRFPVDPDKIFLSGVSDGATGCYAAANFIPGPFAGFIAVSGLGGMLESFGIPLVPDNLKKRPIYNVNAGLDHLYPVDTVKRFVNALKALGVPISANYYDRERHGFDYREKEMRTLAGKIRTWSRPANDDYAWTFIRGFPGLPGNVIDWKFADTALPMASISGFWRDDTLFLNARNLAGLSFTGRKHGLTETVVRCSFANQTRTSALVPVTMSWRWRLCAMNASCFPLIHAEAIYSISF